METVVKKWGNSLGIRIPSFIVRELSLQKMLSQIHKRNIHKEVDVAGPAGKEIW